MTKRSHSRALELIFALFFLACLPATGADPSFTADQVASGGQEYRRHCSTCHGPRLRGEHVIPALVGDPFDRSFRGKNAGVLAFHLRRMPPEPQGSPGSLSDEAYANITAFIFDANGFEAGDEALPGDVTALQKVDIPGLEGADFDPYAPVGSSEGRERLAGLTPVTDEIARNPSPDDWLHTQGGYAGQTYSPLDQINRDSLDFLAPRWRARLQDGVNMPMPIVHDGVMFLHSFPDTVLALDAATGDVLWSHRYEPTSGGASQKMGLALARDLVLVPMSDLHVVALRAKTGEKVWDHAIELPTPGARAAYNLRSAPLVVGDKVIQGVTASFAPRGGFLTALDLGTGEEVWRFHTIARPGEPYGDTWNDVPLDKRSGGSIWHHGTYDPELDLLYYGIAPTYDTGPLLHAVDKDGVSSEAMYTNCTVALRPSTGELVWYYQHMENDQWDLDWVFERQLATIDIDGEPRRVVMNVGKMAMLEALDAKTGEYLFTIDAGIQNVITAVDEKTGAKTIDSEKWPDPEKTIVVCPSALGSRSWPPTAYSPKSNMVYLPLTESCMSLGPMGARLLTSGVGIGPATHPESADGKIGRVQAVDLDGRELGWLHHQEHPISTGILATAGGVVFAGDLAPSLKALDDTTGEVLWEAPLDDHPSSGVITYRVDGTQYIAVVVGVSNFHIMGLQGGLLGGVGGSSSGGSPRAGAGIWAFAM